MISISERSVQVGAWLLAVATVCAAVIAWAQVRLTGSNLTAYDIFPLLGLSAFGLMWTHYITGAILRWLNLPRATLRQYFKLTSWFVLVLILLHPGIFLTRLWLDGFGLPPFSYWQVYTDALARIALLLGTLSLVAFLSYELHRKFRQASWWHYIEYANIVAMLAIFYHGLTLGGELKVAWFRVVWLMYFVSFIVVVIYNQIYKRRRKT